LQTQFATLLRPIKSTLTLCLLRHHRLFSLERKLA